MAVLLSPAIMGVLGIAVVIIMAIFFIVVIFKNIPWAWTMYRCFQQNLPCVFMHFPKGGLEIATPKLEKELREGVPHTYYYLPKWGIKIPDTAGDNTELLMGKLRIIHYFKNSTVPINVLDTVALDRLKNWLNSKGLNIQNREDVVVFFLNDYTKNNNIINTIAASSVEDEETKKFIINTISVIEEHADELKKIKINDGILTFQTAMMALDKSVAFTSAAFSNAKSAIEAQIRAKQLEDSKKELAKTVIIISILLVCAAIAYAIISKSGAL